MYWYQESMRVLLIVDATTEALLFGLPVGVEKNGYEKIWCFEPDHRSL